MEKEMALEHLPLEVIELIVSYLSVVDLSHCVAISQSWYNLFSSDIFWKKHCVTNSSEYLSKSKCLVEPGFEPPNETLLPVQKNRLGFLIEQHLWKNWDSGRFKKEEIEFDCDDSISYNIKVSFLDNDHLCLHQTFQTEVWNVAETPFSVMTIPYCLKELWENNIYKVVENNLIVIQCNVVQVYKIDLDSITWCLSHIFFFNKPEEFSSSITAETDVDAIFQLESISSENDMERVISGETNCYLFGVYKGEETPLPVIHVWNVMTGEKIKEVKYEISYTVELTAPANQYDTFTLVTFTHKSWDNHDNREGHLEKSCSKFYGNGGGNWGRPCYHSGSVIYFDGRLSVVRDSPNKIFYHFNAVPEYESVTVMPDNLRFIEFVRRLGENLLMFNRNQLSLVTFNISPSGNLTYLALKELFKVDFRLTKPEVLFDRYVLLHDAYYDSIKTIWKVSSVLNPSVWDVGRSWRQVIQFPPDSGTFAASNKAGSKIVLERANKLIVLNFW